MTTTQNEHNAWYHIFTIKNMILILINTKKNVCDDLSTCLWKQKKENKPDDGATIGGRRGGPDRPVPAWCKRIYFWSQIQTLSNYFPNVSKMLKLSYQKNKIRFGLNIMLFVRRWKLPESVLTTSVISLIVPESKIKMKSCLKIYFFKIICFNKFIFWHDEKS